MVGEPENTQPAAASSVPSVIDRLQHPERREVEAAAAHPDAQYLGQRADGQQRQRLAGVVGQQQPHLPSVPSVRKSMPSDRAMCRRLGVGSKGSTSTRDGPPMS